MNPFVLILIRQFTAKFMVDEFTFKTGVTTSGAISIFHSGEGVVFEVRIGLYGGDVGDFFFSAMVITAKTQRVFVPRVGDGRSQLIVCQIGA